MRDMLKAQVQAVVREQITTVRNGPAGFTYAPFDGVDGIEGDPEIRYAGNLVTLIVVKPKQGGPSRFFKLTLSEVM